MMLSTRNHEFPKLEILCNKQELKENKRSNNRTQLVLSYRTFAHESLLAQKKKIQTTVSSLYSN